MGYDLRKAYELHIKSLSSSRKKKLKEKLLKKGIYDLQALGTLRILMDDKQ